MNFKERGITVGDLVITTVIIVSTIFIFNKLKDDKQSNLQVLKEDAINLVP